MVVTARRGPLFTQALKYGLYAMGSGIASLFCFYLWLAMAFYLIKDPGIIIEPSTYIIMTLLAICYCVGAVVCFGQIRQMRTSLRLLMAVQKLWVAVTPTGVLEYRGPKLGIGFTCPFADALSIERTIKYPSRFTHRVALTFWRHHPTLPKRRLGRVWFINPCFAIPDQFEQIVIDAQRAYHSRAAARSLWNTAPALQPADACQRMRNNPMGWSWTLAVSGVLFLLMAFAWIAFVVWIYRSHPGDALPWVPYALSGFMLALGPICWLIAWRVGDWKIAVIE